MPHLVSAFRRASSPVGPILIAVAVVGVAALLWKVADVFMIAFGAILVAATLRAAMDPVMRWSGMRERWALLTVVAVLLLVGSLLSWQFGRQAAQQFAEMRVQLPEALEKFQVWLSESKAGQIVLETVKKAGEEGGSVANAGMALGATLNGVGDVLLILVVGIYLAADPRLYRDGALRLLPVARRPQVGEALDEAGNALRKWLLAQLVIMGAVGVMTGVGLALLGVPLWLSLGLLSGLLEFVPVVGPLVALVPGVLLAFAQGPTTAVYVLGLYLLVQQIESNILTPLIQRWAAELAPVLALLAIVAGGLLFGVLGVVFATPLAVVVVVLVRRLYVEDTLESGPATVRTPARGAK